MLILGLQGREERLEITVTHVGETLHVIVYRTPGSQQIRIGFEGPAAFNIVRDEVLRRRGGEAASRGVH